MTENSSDDYTNIQELFDDWLDILTNYFLFTHSIVFILETLLKTIVYTVIFW